MKQEFDTTVHVRNAKTGNIVRTQPYKLYVSAEHGKVYERPPGSGECYSADGTRLDQTPSYVADANKANPVSRKKLVDVEQMRQQLRKEMAAEVRAEVEESVKAEHGVVGAETDTVEAEIAKEIVEMKADVFESADAPIPAPKQFTVATASQESSDEMLESWKDQSKNTK